VERQRFVILNRVLASERPAWDVVVDGVDSDHSIAVDASAEEAQSEAEKWLHENLGVTGVVWEPAGDSAFLGRWDV
jgi:hypothetical protein